MLQIWSYWLGCSVVLVIFGSQILRDLWFASWTEKIRQPLLYTFHREIWLEYFTTLLHMDITQRYEVKRVGMLRLFERCNPGSYSGCSRLKWRSSAVSLNPMEQTTEIKYFNYTTNVTCHNLSNTLFYKCPQFSVIHVIRAAGSSVK